jgi:formylglycine-generating enzyme required for sulfatase activity
VTIGSAIAIPAGHVDRAGAIQPEEQVGGRGDVAAFSIDAHEVTNQQYAAFVAATHYVTVAERAGPDGSPLGAAVFDRRTGQWRVDPHANWRHPEGAGSSILGRERYPVVAVAYEDAQAYARWSGRRLPTENEWEFAMRGAAPAPADVSAEAFDASGHPVANTWQGIFPIEDSGSDGFRGLAPVGCFPPNARGLYDMIGNVWEWTSDRFEGVAPQEPLRNAADQPRVLKGGSNLCARNFCSRFRSGSRQPGDPGLGMSHVGFRTAADG